MGCINDMNMKKWIEDIKNSEIKKAMPVLSFPSVQIMNVTVKDLIESSDLQAKGMKLVADRVNSLASVSLMDLSIESECFGSKIKKFDDEVPAVINEIVSSVEEAKALKIPEVSSGRAGLYIESIEKATKLITDRPIFAGVIGAYSLAGRLIGVSESMIYCYEEPEMLHIVLEKCTEFLINYIKEYKRVGANGVVIAEPLTGLLSPSLAEEFSEPYLKKIIESVKDDGFAVIYHNCGNATIQMIDSILRVNADAYHFGNAIDIREMLTKVPQDTVVMGNIDPASQFRNGTPESMKKVTLDLLNDCSKYPNFVISSGCDIPPMAKWENIDAFFETVDSFYKR